VFEIHVTFQPPSLVKSRSVRFIACHISNIELRRAPITEKGSVSDIANDIFLTLCTSRLATKRISHALQPIRMADEGNSEISTPDDSQASSVSSEVGSIDTVRARPADRARNYGMLRAQTAYIDSVSFV